MNFFNQIKDLELFLTPTWALLALGLQFSVPISYEAMIRFPFEKLFSNAKIKAFTEGFTQAISHFPSLTFLFQWTSLTNLACWFIFQV